MLAGFFLLVASLLVLFSLCAAWKRDTAAEALFSGGAFAVTLTGLLGGIGFQYDPSGGLIHIQCAELAITIMLLCHACIFNREPNS